MPSWDLVLEKKSRIQLNHDNARGQLKAIAQVVGRNKSLGFEGKIGRLHDPKVVTDEDTQQEMYRYLVKLRLVKARSNSETTLQKQFEHILRIVTGKAQAKGWTLLSERPQAATATTTAPISEVVLPPRPEFVVPELTEAVFATYFSGVYEREAHIRTIHDGVKSYIDTLKRNKSDPRVSIARSHVLLKGKPAGCKTTLFERFKVWYEANGDGKTERVLFVDGPTMSKAGLENFLLERAEEQNLPEILVIEEIEKQDPNNLLTLVSLMGSGYVSKLNARVGFRKEMANVLVWATCNEEEVIQKFRNGVLWSRFVQRRHCSRPSKELMHKILLDRVEKVNGNPLWVERVMEFAFEIVPRVTGRPLDDPREIQGLLDGRDRLLDGSYQRDIIDIVKAELAEKRQDHNES